MSKRQQFRILKALVQNFRDSVLLPVIFFSMHYGTCIFSLCYTIPLSYTAAYIWLILCKDFVCSTINQIEGKVTKLKQLHLLWLQKTNSKLHSRRNLSLIQLLSNKLKCPKTISYIFGTMFPTSVWFSFYLVLVIGSQFIPRFWIIFLVPAIERNTEHENILRKLHCLQKKQNLSVYYGY